MRIKVDCALAGSVKRGQTAVSRELGQGSTRRPLCNHLMNHVFSILGGWQTCMEMTGKSAQVIRQSLKKKKKHQQIILIILNQNTEEAKAIGNVYPNLYVHMVVVYGYIFNLFGFFIGDMKPTSVHTARSRSWQDKQFVFHLLMLASPQPFCIGYFYNSFLVKAGVKCSSMLCRLRWLCTVAYW